MMTITSHRGKIKLWKTRQILAEGAEKSTIPESLRDRAHLLRGVPGRESHHSRDLKQTNLEGIRRTDFHTEETPVSNAKHDDKAGGSPEGDVSVQSERNGVHELCGVRYESKQGDAEELFVDSRSFEHNIHHIDKQFCTTQFLNRFSKKIKLDVPAITA